MNKKKDSTPPQYQTLRKMRGDWGNIKPVTKVIPDKRRKKPKYKREDDQYDEGNEKQIPAEKFY